MKCLLSQLLILMFTCNLSKAGIYRTCRNDSIILPNVENISHEYFIDTKDSLNGTETIQLKVNISWSLSEDQDSNLDGFLVRFLSALKHARDPSLVPTNVCYQGNDHFWVRTTDQSQCTKSNKLCDINNAMSTNSSKPSCLCLKNNCSLLYKGRQPSCRGTDHWISNGPGSYLSIHPNTRTLTFNIDFHESYVFSIHPYHREITKLNRHGYFVSHKDCVEVVMKSKSRTLLDASELCCKNKVPHTNARNVTILNITPDFKADAVNMTIMFYPPINKENLTRFILFPNFDFAGYNSNNQLPGSTKPKSIPLSPPPDVERCDITQMAYQTTLYNLLPGQNYTLQILTNYEENDHFKYNCHQGRCLKIFRFSVPDINPCLYEYCDQNADCETKHAPSSSNVKATCRCKAGYEGNGVSRTWNILSSGCYDADHCNVASNASLCAANAYCEDKPAPQEGATCACFSGFYGDGFKRGSGCSSKAILGLKIGVPVTVVFMLIVVVIAWKLRIYKLYKNKFRFGRFETNNVAFSASNESLPTR